MRTTKAQISLCIGAQPGQLLCSSLLRLFTTHSFKILDLKPPTGISRCAGGFMSDLVAKN